jgi:hypothetical protein
MSRSTQTLTRAQAAAFDFDVVTDVPAKPARKPKPAPTESDLKAARDPSPDPAD